MSGLVGDLFPPGLALASGAVGTGLLNAAAGNGASTGGVVRAPRLRLLVGDLVVQGVKDAFVAANNHYAADRFTITIALGVDPVATAAFWSAQNFFLVDLQAGFAPATAPLGAMAWVSLIQGAVDSVQIDVLRQTVQLQGRDLTAVFIESRIQQSFANQTASDIATTLAGNHNLQAVVTPTTTPVGRYYNSEHDRITLDQFSRATTEWNLLVWLAEREGFDVFVQGTTLYFQPPNPASVPALTLSANPESGNANALDIVMERALTLAGDISVTVKSWNSRQGAAFTQTVTASGVSALGSQGARPQSYVFVRPNLTPDEALRYATAKLQELTLHERVVIVRLPGELTLTPRDMIAISGTGTAFDQLYFIDTIEREIRFDGGFTERIRAKNTSPGREVTPPGNLVIGTTTP
ncbi:MAG: phage late control D family protein [Acidibrevibacterium sp.]|uniref:phage late control D family protein n=1 Tax=Acidibrevibacterium sp. TaxID=2606776 RepID=UPI003D048EAC